MGINESAGLVNRFLTLDRGYIITTGNSMLLCQPNANGSSGPFITTDTSKQVSGYPAGTTWSWQGNSSTAVLNLESGSNILYAELIWYSATIGGGVDLSSHDLDAITFITPTGTSNISPQNSQKDMYESNIGYIKVFRSANVTNIVANGGSGNYTVAAIPSLSGTQQPAVRCGWALTVVVGNNSESYRVLRVDTGVVLTYQPNSVTTTLNNFSTPSSGAVKGRLNMVVADGEQFLDSSSAGPNSNSLVRLGNSVGIGSTTPTTPPYNPYNNIFGGVINIADPLDPNVGKLDTRGTFGNLNHNPFTLEYSSIARNKWDILSLDLSPALTNNQTQLIIKNSADGTSAYYEFIQASIQVDVQSPNLSFQFSVDQGTAYLGQTITYRAIITNNGGAIASGATYSNPFSSSITFNSGSVIVNGTSQPSYDPNAGFPIGDISPGQTVNISYSLKCIVSGSSWTLGNKGTLYYTFQPITGTTINGSLISNYVTTNLLDLSVNKSVDRVYSSVGYTLTYTVTVQNLGLVTASNIKLTDAIPSGTTLIANSFSLNGTIQSGVDPSASVVLPDIAGQTTLTTTWKIQVPNTIPEVNPITNTATVDTQVGVVKNTNSVSTQINYADLMTSGNVSKSVDKAYADLNDIVTYTINIKNTGNVVANNVYIQDYLPSQLTFQSGSTSINGSVVSDTPDGVNVRTIAAGATAVVTMKAKITSLPDSNSNPISNIGNISYAYTVDPASPDAVVLYTATNKSKTQISNVTITSVKSVDKQYANTGDTITYSVLLTNTGNVSANNVLFTDPAPGGTTFVSGSVSVGGVSNPSANPNTGISIPNIPANGNTTVIFKIKVGATVPSQNPLQNSSTTTYTYIVNPNNSPVNATSTSNVVNTQINHAELLLGNNFTKTVDKQYADIGDILTYTISVKNSGNVPASSVNITDNLGTGLSYQSGSLTIDGTTNSATPTGGISISSIAPNQTSIIIFKAQVTVVPIQNPISNVANINYTYTVDPASPNALSANGGTSPVTTQINHGELLASGNSTKAVDLAFAKVNNILTYTMNFKNTGNVAVNNVTVTDAIPASTSFVSGSVVVNGTSSSNANPAIGINVGSIASNTTTTLAFKVKVTSLPTNNLVSNQANFTYNYTVNPSSVNGVSQSGGTNSVSTTVSQPDFVGSTSSNFVKVVDKLYADIGTVVTYTLTLKNTGNTSATSVVLTDTIQTGAKLQTGSVTINGATNATADPNAGINLGTIAVNQTVAVVYKVTITSLPSSGILNDFASIAYNYTLNPANANSESDTATSNTVTTVINHADLLSSGNLTKSVDKQFADLNDIVTYTLTVANTGNVPANNVTLTDAIPTGASYQTGTLSINGVSNAGDITKGVNIGSISNNSSSTIVFKVKITSIPSQNPIKNSAGAAYTYTVDPASPNGASASGNTNNVTTQINNATLTSVESVNKQYGDTGEILTYSIVLTNTGNVSASNVILTDTPPTGTSLVSNSVTIASLPKPGTTPLTGINVGTILGGGTTTVTFQVQVGNTIPTQNPISNNSTTSYNYLVDPSKQAIAKSITSNSVTTQINHSDLITSGNFTKAVDKQYVDLGDVITYTINLTNSGNASANNVVITDIIGNGATYATGTLTIDGTASSADPNKGITVGTVSSTQTRVIVFAVNVTSLPTQNPISNGASVNYAYTVNPANPNGVVATTNTNNVTTTVNHADLLTTGNVTIAVDKSYAKLNDILTYTINLNNLGNSDATNVTITDALPQQLSFVAGSVTINGTPSIILNPTAGANIGTVSANSTTIVTFTAKATALPTSKVVNNGISYTYSYTVDPTNSIIKNQSGSTSTVQTTIIQPGFGGSSNFVCSVDKQYGDISDLLTYTINITNSGNIIANNVIVKDTIPQGANFKSGSVTINGTASSTANPGTGINVGSIDVNQTAVVVFNATVLSIPPGNIINNQASLSYTYTLNPAYPNGQNGSLTSNISSTTVNTATILASGNFTKAVDKLYADIGDLVTYTVNIKNSGSVSANNVVFTDLIPSGASYQSGSLTINGTSNSNDPNTGVNIGTISSNSTKTLIFKAKVNSLPTQNPIQNTGSITFNYTTDPSKPNGKSGSGNSNMVATQINTVNLTTTQTLDKQYAGFSDIITYTFTLSNTGNISASQVVFTDAIPSGATLVPNSLSLGGISQNGADPSKGFSVGSIGANSSAVISFQVQVGNTLPSVNPIPNSASVSFSYLPDPNGTSKSGSSNSNSVTTQVIHVDMSGTGNFTKAVDKQYGDIGTLLNYTINVQNPGNVSANNVVVIDSIPTGATYQSGTLTVNGNSQSDDPNVGIKVGTIAASKSAIIVFTTKVTSVPPQNPLSNIANLTYNYTIDPNNPNSGGGTASSNSVTTQINHVDLSTGNVSQVVDKSFAKVGDTLTFTVTFKNTGNVSINNLVFTDALDPALSLIPGSIMVNGTQNTTGSLTLGVNIGTVATGSTTTISFGAKINSLPTSGTITNTPSFNCNYTVDPSSQNGVSVSGSSNPVTVTIVQPGFGGGAGGTGSGGGSNPNFINAVDKQYADVGDILTYTITLKNAGNIIANNVILTNPMPQGTTFKSGSVTVNGTSSTSASPINGVTIGSVDVNKTAIVTFQVTVTSIPQSNAINNQASVSYNYTLDPSKPNGQSGSMTSNTISTTINSVNILSSGNFVQSVDKQFADIGDIVTYTISIKNSGTVSANNSIFTDLIQKGASYQTGTLFINGTANSGDPNTGINIGTINSNSTKTIVFKVKITSIPTQNPIQNTGSLAFNYTTDPAAPNGKSGSGSSNIVSTQVVTASLTNTQTIDKQSAGFSDIITYSFTLANIGNTIANEVVFTNPIPTGVSFLANSLTLAGNVQTGADSSKGFSVGSIGANSSVVITFQTQVGKTIPNVNPVSNSSSVSFSYLVDPNLSKKTGSVNSNALTTQIVNVDLSGAGNFTKTVDKQYGDIGTILTYTINVINPGNIPANNVVVVDSVPTGTTYQSGSLTVNGNSQSDDPSVGIKVGTISPNQTSVIVFTAKVTSVPPQNPLSNVANLTYNYTTNPNSPNSGVGTATSNSVTTQINHVDLSTGNVSQSIDKTFAKVGDTLTFTVTFNNTGNVPINNLTFTDALDPTLSLVPGSIMVNGTQNNSGSLSLGVNIGTVNNGSTDTITFQAKINSLPTGGTITNTPSFNCNYTVDPSAQNGVSVSGSSNPVTVTIVQPGFGGGSGGVGSGGGSNPNFTNAVDKQYGDIGDILTYTLTLTNAGNVIANNVILTNPMPQGTTFKSGSVIINGTASTSANPVNGVTIGSLDVNKTSVVVFQVVIASIPQGNVINSQATVNYSYTLDPSKPNGQSGSMTSNTISTTINSVNILSSGNFVQSVDKKYADIGDLVTYTVNIKNSGTVSANNTVFTDLIPKGAVYQTGTLTINGTANSSDPNSGINIGTINSNGTSMLIFKAKITSIPTQNPIQNTSSLAFKYTTDPTKPNAKSGSGNSNTVSTQIVTANLTNTQVVDKQSAGFSDIITYNFTLANTGNTTANEVLFTNPIPTGVSLLANSLTLAGNVQTGADPSKGFSVGSIGANSSVVITFQAQVGKTIPNVNPVSNSSSVSFSYLVDPNLSKKTGSVNSNALTTQIVNVDLSGAGNFTKTVDKQYGDIGTILTYTINVINPGNIPANNVVVVDSVPTGTTYQSGSLTVNGNSQSDDPSVGINVGTISPNQTTVIVFTTKVNSIPPQNPLSNVANLTYNYTTNSNSPNSGVGTATSNSVTTQINHVDLSTGNVSQSIDKTFAKVGDNLTFTVTFNNTGNIPINNLTFTDALDPSLSLVPGSIMVNGTQNTTGSLSLGVNIGTVSNGSTATITFQAKINSLPTGGAITNTPSFNCNYTVDPSAQNGVSVSGSSNPVTVTVVQPGFGGGSGGTGSGGSSNPNFTNVVDKQYGDIGDLITYILTIKNAGNTIANNVILTDLMTKETTFKQGTVIVNGVTATSANPVNGITVGSIDVNKSVTVSFKATINSVPQGNIINNQASVSYNYTLDPSKPNGQSGSLISNVASTTVNTANILSSGNFLKSVDKKYADIGDLVTYTVNIKNSGTVSANNVIFTDLIPKGILYQSGTLSVNGTANSGDPNAGVNIGTVNSNTTKSLIFKAKVTSVPTQNPIQNTSSIAFNYTTDPANPNSKSGSGSSNMVSTQIVTASLSTTQTVDKQYAGFSDVITYSFTITNNGNTSANEVVFTNPIPLGTTLLANSLALAGVTQTGVDPSTGFAIGIIPPNSSAILSFKVQAGNTIPTINPISNSASVTFSYMVDPNLSKKTGTSASNAVTTQIVNINLMSNGSFTKSVDKQYATIGDLITYTVNIKNQGNIDANNVVVIDSVPTGATYQSGTLSVNGNSQSDDPSVGIKVGTISPTQTTVIVFSAKVVSIPPQNPLSNVANLTYNYTVDPNNPNSGVGTGESNAVTTQINYVNLDLSTGNVSQSVDKTFAKVGDNLTFTVTFNNTGNVPINNLLFTDTLDPILSLVPGSISVNGTQNSTGSLNLGVNVGTVNKGATATITFQAKINSIPTSGSITNTPSFNCNYTVDPSSQNGVSISGSSNPVTIQIVQPGFGASTGGSSGTGGSSNPNFTNAVDKQYGDIGDLLTYTVSITNSGTTLATNVVLTDAIQKEAIFKAGTVTINGIAAASASPITGIKIGNIDVNQTTTVIFKVAVMSIPQGNIISNQASLNFNYTLDPSKPNGEVGNLTSNIVTTTINSASGILSSGSFIKSVDKQYADIGDLITYTVNINNPGSVSANNLVFTDLIPKGTLYQSGSLTLNGTSNSGDPNLGVNIGTLTSSGTKTLVFKTKVTSVPTQNPVQNSSSLSFNYTTDPANPNSKSSSGNSNIVSTQIVTANISVTQTIDKQFVDLGGTITYTFILANNGNTNANEVVFKNPIPTGLTFISNSLTLGGVVQNGIDPSMGLTVGSIPPNSSISIIFKAQVGNTIPITNPIPNSSITTFSYLVDPKGTKKTGSSNSNSVTTQVVNANLISNGGFSKTVDKQYADLGDVLTYTINIKNSGNITATNVVVIDLVPNGATYKTGTLTVNGIAKNDDPNVGINVGSVPSNQTAIIVFNAVVKSIPSQNPLSNLASLTYNYTIDPSNPNSGVGTGESNIVTTQINHANLLNSGNVVQSVDKTFAQVGDVLTYSVTFKNSGNIPIDNLVFTDTLDKVLSFIPNSISVNGIPNNNGNLISGVNIGTVSAGGNVVISFKAKINTLPANKTITNTPNFNCNYTVDPSVPNGVAISASANPVTITVVQPGFGGGSSGSGGSSGGNFKQTVDKSYADLGEILTYTFTIQNSGNISADNVVLTNIIPTGAKFKPGTVTIDGVNNPFSNPNVGINLGTIYQNQTVNVVFKATVTSVLQSGTLDNTGSISFNYTLDPNYPDGQSQSLTSNKTSVNIVHGEVNSKNAIKSADKIETTQGDIITYTITATNTGNITLTNVIVVDAMPIGVTFVTGSVLINSIPSNTSDPTLGINVGSVGPGENITVVFKVSVNSNAGDILSNTANINYNYLVDPSKPVINGTISTNKVVVHNIKPNLDITTTSDRIGGISGSIIKYTVTAQNLSPVTLHNIVLKASVSNQLNYIGNVTINGVSNSGDFRMGINIGELQPNETVILTYDTKIISSSTQSAQNELAITLLNEADMELAVGSSNQIVNQVSTSFNYTINGGNSTFNSTVTTSTTNSVQVFNPSVVLEKTCNKTIAKVGDTFAYTIMATNTGNIDIQDCVLQDNIPTQFNITQIKVNGTIVQGNIATGILTGPISIGETIIISITVEALSINPTSPLYVNQVIGNFKTLPDPNFPTETITETATVSEGITVVEPSISLTKSSSVKYAAVGDIIPYSLVVKNTGTNDTGSMALMGVTVQDYLTPELQFVKDSLIVNGVSYPGVNISDGIDVGTLNVNDISTINFEASIIKPKATPISNTSSVKYTFKLDSNYPNQVGTLQSNTVNVTALNPNLTVLKEVDKQTASLNDTLNYTISIQNTGDLDLINVVFTDTISTITTLIDGSFSLLGKIINSVELDKGITLGNISKGQEIIIKYSCLVKGINATGKAENVANLFFSYILPDQTTGSKEVSSNNVVALINLNSFKQFTISEYIVVPSQKPDVKMVNNVTGDIEILKYNVIQTSKLTSLEGQELSGYKLIIHGVLHEIVEYVADDLTESVHAVHEDFKFSTFIILPANYDPMNKLDLSAILEKSYANNTDPRTLFSNATVLITAKILSN